MSTLAIITTLIKYLPELVKLGKFIIKQTQDGVEAIEIKRSIKIIDKAFDEKDPQTKSVRLDELFRGKK